MKNFKNISKHIHKVFSENYPLGADLDSRAPWKQEEGTSVVSFEPNFTTGTFEVNLSDGQTAYIDFEPIIEQYFKEYSGSMDSFDAMFPVSNDMYSDIVKYLVGQGHDFKYALENEVANGELNYSQHEPELSQKKEFVPTWRNLKKDSVPNLDEENEESKEIGNEKKPYVIYQVVATSAHAHPKYIPVDSAATEEEAKYKEELYQTLDTAGIYIVDKPKPDPTRFHINEKRR